MKSQCLFLVAILAASLIGSSASTQPVIFQGVDSNRPMVKNTELLEDSVRYTIQRGSEVRFVQLRRDGNVPLLTVQDEQANMRAVAVSLADNSARPAIVLRFGLSKSVADPATDDILTSDLIERLPLPKGAEAYSWKNTFSTRTAKGINRGVVLKVNSLTASVDAKRGKSVFEIMCGLSCFDSVCACVQNAFCALRRCETETCRRRESERMNACLGNAIDVIYL